MTDDQRQPGVRITVGKKGKRAVLFLSRTKKSGPESNAPHVIVSDNPKVIGKLDPITVGTAVLNALDLP